MLKRIFVTLAAGTLSAFAAQFTITTDICQDAGGSNCVGNASYNGPNDGNTQVFTGSGSIADRRGTSNDGGDDAFDTFGWVANLGNLSLNVHSDANTSNNVFRWLVTLTNGTGGTINQSINFVGDYGSDSGTQVIASGNYYRVTNDGGPSDPVIGFVFGNNSTAGGFTYALGPGFHSSNDRMSLEVPVSLGSGQSVSYLFLAFLAEDESDRSGDNALATSTAQNLVNSPDLGGLSQQEIASIANFSFDQVAVPEPATFALFGGALACIGLLRRRK